MSYELTFSLALGQNKTGLSLAAQFVNTSGSHQGSAITTGFAEMGSGTYLYYRSDISDSFRGGVKFHESASPNSTLAFTAINPQETENPDVKTSTVSGGGGLAASTVRNEVDDALSLIGLDHLFSASGTDSDLVTGAFWTQIAASSGDWSQYNKSTDSLEAIRNRGDSAWTTGAGAGGAGASVFPIVVNDENGNPIHNAEVWITTGPDPNVNIVAGTLRTDATGGASPMLDAGSPYYLWRNHTQYDFNNPLLFEVG